MKLKALIIGAALAAGSLSANTVTLLHTPNNGVPDGTGGEFKAVSSNNGTFFTFCLEAHINVAYNTLYSYTIDSRAYAGGLDAHDPIGTGPTGDPISVGTAYLYTRFVLGNLIDSDNVGNYNDQHDLNAGLLQKAIWALEDEDWYQGYTNYYTNLVAGVFGSLNNARATYTGTSVKVMNLWDIRTNEDVQSQLVYVPDSGMTAALLGLGLLSLIAFRRKL